MLPIFSRSYGLTVLLAALALNACAGSAPPLPTGVTSPADSAGTPGALAPTAAAPTAASPAATVSTAVVATAAAPTVAATSVPSASAGATTGQATGAPTGGVPASGADAPIAPIVDASWGFLLGGVQAGRWITAEVAAPLVVGGEQYRLVIDGTLSGVGEGGPAVTAEVPCDYAFDVDISNVPEGYPVEQPEMLAVGGAWELFPQVGQDQSVDQAVYREALVAELEMRGIGDSEPQIDRILRVDIEGDGVDEVIIAASYFRDRFPEGGIGPNAATGDYSLVLLRKLVDGQVVTVPVAEEFYVRDQEFVAPLEHMLVGALDLNGDGSLELVLRSRYYEGSVMSVYEVGGTVVSEVLSAGCGV